MFAVVDLIGLYEYDIRYPNSSVLSYKKFDVAEVVLNDANQTSNGKKNLKKFN